MLLSLTALQTALEVGAIYSLVALALFISFSILNIADLSTDGCYTLGFAVGATVTLACLLYTSTRWPSPTRPSPTTAGNKGVKVCLEKFLWRILGTLASWPTLTRARLPPPSVFCIRCV